MTSPEYSMLIRFCDVCDESVPQADLDGGRAVVRQGRVLCASCDVAMSSEGSIAREPLPAPLEAVMELSHAADAPDRRTEVGSSQRHQRNRRPTHGPVGFMFVTFCALTLGLTGAGAYLFDRYEVQGARLRHELDLLRVQGGVRYQDVEAQLSGTLEEAEADRGTQRERVDELAEQVANLGDLQMRSSAEQGKEIEALRARRASGDELADAVENQRLDLVRVATTVAELHADVLEFGTRLERSRLQPVGLPSVEQPAPSDPDWYRDLPKLKSTNPGQRWEAVTALGASADERAAPYLLPMLRDVDIFVRMASARILGDLGSKLGIPALIDTLEDEESSVREAAVISLRLITGSAFKFKPNAKESERAKRIKLWRAWWKDASESYGM